MKLPGLRHTPETRQPLWTRGAQADPQPATGRDKATLPCHIMNVSESPFLNCPTRITTAFPVPRAVLSQRCGNEGKGRKRTGKYIIACGTQGFLSSPGLHLSNCCSGIDGAPGTDPGAGDGGVTKVKDLLSWSLRSRG